MEDGDGMSDKENKIGMKYYKKLWGGAFISLGLYFIIEHLIVWGEFEFSDFIGHEWFGLLLFLIGVGFFVTFKKKES